MLAMKDEQQEAVGMVMDPYTNDTKPSISLFGPCKGGSALTGHHRSIATVEGELGTPVTPVSQKGSSYRN